jgi:hypothetical protein
VTEQRTVRPAVPWKRIAAEGATIVLSILLAFAIDSAWSRHQQDSRERATVLRLADELDFFEELLIPQAEERTERAADAVDLLLRVVHGEVEAAPEEIDEALGLVTAGYQFAAASPVFRLLTADGGLNRVKDPELNEALADMASFLELIERFEAMDEAFVTGQLVPYLTRHADRYRTARGSWAVFDEDFPPSVFPCDDALLADREFSNLLVERKRRMGTVSPAAASCRPWSTASSRATRSTASTTR